VLLVAVSTLQLASAQIGHFGGLEGEQPIAMSCPNRFGSHARTSLSLRRRHDHGALLITAWTSTPDACAR